MRILACVYFIIAAVNVGLARYAQLTNRTIISPWFNYGVAAFMVVVGLWFFATRSRADK
jgi:hypothetical protein